MRILNGLLWFSCIIIFSCSGRSEISGSRLDNGLIENDQINEASGIDASQKISNILWTHNDSGDLNRIFAFDISGKHKGTFILDGVTARDWEDIAIGPGPENDKSYIYVGDIGDNRAQYEDKYIYRVEEPGISSLDKTAVITLTGVETIHFRYPDGNRDAETLMVDPITKDIVIISKREENVRVYRLPYPQNTSATTIAEKIVNLPYTQICGGDISDSGSKILIKNYDDIFFWSRDTGQSIEEAMSRKAKVLEYIPEPQGESVCWSSNEMGYFTLSEEANNEEAHLYYYPFNN